MTFVAEDSSTVHTKELDAQTPVPGKLVLKVGAQVMLLKNISISKSLVNGARGVVKRFENGLPVVKFRNVEYVAKVRIHCETDFIDIYFTRLKKTELYYNVLFHYLISSYIHKGCLTKNAACSNSVSVHFKEKVWKEKYAIFYTFPITALHYLEIDSPTLSYQRCNNILYSKESDK